MAASTQEQRAEHVAQMRANFGIEGMQPDADDLIWQQRYIDGTASIDDLLQHARDFATKQRGKVQLIMQLLHSNSIR